MEISQTLKKDSGNVKGLLRELVSLKESEVEVRNDLVEQIRGYLEAAQAGSAASSEVHSLVQTLQSMDYIGAAWRPVAHKLKEALDAPV